MSDQRIVFPSLSDALARVKGSQTLKNSETFTSILEVLKGKELGMCCAPNCPNGFNYRRKQQGNARYKKPPKDFVVLEEYCIMFPVPRNPIRHKIWTNFFKKKGIANPVMKKFDVICSIHFQMDDMFVKPYTSSKLNTEGTYEIQTKYFTYLKPEALPIYLFGRPKNFQPSKRKPPKQRPPPLLPHEKEALKSAPTEILDEFEAVDMVTPTGSPIMFDVGSPIAVPLMDDNVLVVLQSESPVDPLSETPTSTNVLNSAIPSTSQLGEVSALSSMVPATDDMDHIQIEQVETPSSSFQFDHNYTYNKEEITIEEYDCILRDSTDGNDSNIQQNAATTQPLENTSSNTAPLFTIAQSAKHEDLQHTSEIVFERDSNCTSIITGKKSTLSQSQGNNISSVQRRKHSHGFIPAQLCVPSVVNSTLLKLAESKLAEKRPAPIWNPDSPSPTKSALPEVEPPNKRFAIRIINPATVGSNVKPAVVGSNFKPAVVGSNVKSAVVGSNIKPMVVGSIVKPTAVATPTSITNINNSFTVTEAPSPIITQTVSKFSRNAPMPIVTATITTEECIETNSDFTYEIFLTVCESVKLPSSQWALQKHVNGNFISFTYIDVHQSGNLSEKRVVFKGNLTPSVWLDGIFKSNFIFEKMQTFGDVEKMIDKLDGMVPCPGTENPSQPYSVACDVYRVLRKKRCDPCRHRSVTLCTRDVKRKQRMKEKLKNVDENPEKNPEGEPAATPEVNKDADEDKTQRLLTAIVQAANAELLSQQKELLAIVNPIVIGEEPAK